MNGQARHMNDIVDSGGYASASEVVRAGLCALQELTALKADIDQGLTDAAARRVQEFDAEQIIERGRQLLARRSRPA